MDVGLSLILIGALSAAPFPMRRCQWVSRERLSLCFKANGNDACNEWGQLIMGLDRPLWLRLWPCDAKVSTGRKCLDWLRSDFLGVVSERRLVSCRKGRRLDTRLS